MYQKSIKSPLKRQYFLSLPNFFAYSFLQQNAEGHYRFESFSSFIYQASLVILSKIKLGFQLIKLKDREKDELNLFLRIFLRKFKDNLRISKKIMNNFSRHRGNLRTILETNNFKIVYIEMRKIKIYSSNRVTYSKYNLELSIV